MFRMIKFCYGCAMAIVSFPRLASEIGSPHGSHMKISHLATSLKIPLQTLTVLQHLKSSAPYSPNFFLDCFHNTF